MSPARFWAANGFRRTAGVIAILGVWALAKAGGDREPRWEVVGTEGRDSRRISKLLDVARAELTRALDGVSGKIGVRPGKLPIRWRLDFAPAGGDARAATPPSDPDVPRHFEAGATDFADGGSTVVVEVKASRFSGWLEGLRATIRHETVHALMASQAGSRERYSSIPWWFREGMALWGSGEGELRVGELAAYLVFRGRGAADFIVGIPFSGRERSRVSAEEAFLAVEWLVSELGEEGIRRLCASVVRGSRLEEELESRFGSLNRLGIALRGGAEARVRKLIPPQRELRFRRSIEASDRDESGTAERNWRELLEEDPEGPLAATLHYLLGRALSKDAFRPAKTREASEHFRTVLEGPSGMWRPEALVLLGECLEREGRREAARELWEEALYGFGDDETVVARARGNLERLLAPRGRESSSEGAQGP